MKSFFMRRVFVVLVLAAVTGLTAWAQGLDPTYPDIHEFQAEPKSAVNAVSGELFGSAIDDYVGVTTWQDVEVEKGYVFLGGTADPNHPTKEINGVDYPININNRPTGALMGGYATNLGSNRLAFFYNGSLVSANGNNNGAQESENVEKKSNTQWNNELAVLFGSEAIGGIRFDLILNPSTEKETSGSKVTSANSLGDVVTTLQWGKAFGDLKPSAMVGFKWPQYNKSNDGDIKETKDNAALGLKLAADYKALTAYYQMTADFGTSRSNKANNDESSTSGYFDNRLGVSYTLEVSAGEKLTLKAKPGLSLGLNFQSNKTTTNGNVSYTQPETRFQIAPTFDVGGKYAVNEKWNLYTGVQVSFLTFDVVGTSTYKPSEGADEVKTTPSAWQLNGLGGKELGLGFELHPSDNLSVEFGLRSYLGESYSDWSLNFSSLGGDLAVNVKF